MSTALAYTATVADAMVRRPKIHGPTTTVADLRAFFRDNHVHIALLVDRGRLIGTVQPTDLTPDLRGSVPAIAIATLDRRTIAPDAALSDVCESMRRDGQRRLAVTGSDQELLGLLCLKANGLGFCSDHDVRSRSSATLGFRS
jgi:CBS domain-containing protein